MRLPLPFPWEMVTTDVLRGGNMGAWSSARGGGWVLNNARFRKQIVGSRL